MSPDERDVLSANAAFYRAFAERDAEAMDLLWARAASVVCVHPGWQALHGRDEVMASWISILANPLAPAIAFSDALVRIGGDMAFVLCIERLPGGDMAATNVFVREGGTWVLCHHHAGPIATEADDDDVPPPEMLN